MNSKEKTYRIKKNIDWIDMAKGVGIFLVVLGHVAKLPNFIGLYIYTFHMPLFFFLSGYLFKPLKYERTIDFLINRARRLILPYFLFSALSFLLYLIINKGTIIRDSLLGYQMRDFFIGLIYAVRGSKWTEHSGPLWFLASLFFAEGFFYLIMKKVKNDFWLLGKILLLISVAIYSYSKLYNHPLPWSIDASLTALVFIGIGFLAKECKIIEKVKPSFSIAFILFLISFMSGISNKPVDMFSGSYGNYFLFYISALAGIVMTITVVRLIKKWSILSFLGQNSLAIMGLHFYIGITFVDYIFKYLRLNNLFFAINYSSRLFILRDLFLLLLVSMGYASLVILTIMPLIFLLKNNWWFLKRKTTSTLAGVNIIN